MDTPDISESREDPSKAEQQVQPRPASRILVLTHDPAGVEQLKEVIEHTWEIPVVIAADAEQATTLFHRMHPDLLVLDHTEAAHFLWQIRQDRRPDGFLPALVLMSNEDEKARREVMMAGATDFLAKPVDLTEAILRIHNLLALREARQGVSSPGNDPAAAGRPMPALADRLAQIRAPEALPAATDRLQALGTMASGIAHDFNHVLTIILGFTEQLLHEGPSLSRPERQELLRTIATAAHDGADMVERLREFHVPTPQEQRCQEVDLNHLVEQCVALTKPKWHTESLTRGAEVTVRQILSQIPPLHGHPAQLREMLTNLIFNAVDAMPAGGKLTLRTACEKDGRVVLEVSDTGMGMTERVRRRCLEPFFTTKGHRGTGMGLPMVQTIAERHGGRLEVESEAGRGTVFRLRFAGCAQPAATPSEDTPGQVGPLDVLVVDDDPLICELIAQMLTEAGHQVRTTHDPHEALRMATAEGLDLVVTDRSMPLMNGEGLAAAIRASYPSTRILLVTGSGADEVETGNIDGVLTKPFAAEALRRKVAEIFTAPAVPAQHRPDAVLAGNR